MSSYLSKHFIDGHFALDNGLYQEAVSDFGTVVEALVNRGMSKKTQLAELIQKDAVAALNSNVREYMNKIKDLRNKVHPNQIADFGRISREEAESARLMLQVILHHFFVATNPLA